MCPKAEFAALRTCEPDADSCCPFMPPPSLPARYALATALLVAGPAAVYFLPDDSGALGKPTGSGLQAVPLLDELVRSEQGWQSPATQQLGWG